MATDLAPRRNAGCFSRRPASHHISKARAGGRCPPSRNARRRDARPRRMPRSAHLGAAHQRAACLWDEVGLAPGGRPVVGGARQAQGPSSIGPGQQFRFSRRSSLRQRSGRVAPDSGLNAAPEFSTEPWPSRAPCSSGGRQRDLFRFCCRQKKPTGPSPKHLMIDPYAVAGEQTSTFRPFRITDRRAVTGPETQTTAQTQGKAAGRHSATHITARRTDRRSAPAASCQGRPYGQPDIRPRLSGQARTDLPSGR